MPEEPRSSPRRPPGEAARGDPDVRVADLRWAAEEDLRPVQRAGLVAAREAWVEAAAGDRGLQTCGVEVRRGAWAGQRCPNPAGLKTPNESLGVGPCFAHGGVKFRGRAEAAWLVGHMFAQELNCTPWEGLLRAVRIAAGKVAYCQLVIGEAASDRELEGRVHMERSSDDAGVVTTFLVDPDTGDPLGVGAFRNRSWWVEKEELWVDRLARYSKAAVDAGVAERLVAQLENEAQAIARVLNAVIDELGEDADPELAARMRARMRTELLALEHEESSAAQVVAPRVIEGHVR